ncbi:MAG: endo-1,4-beta-xylanase [Bacteroidota bacterium]
MNRELLPIIDFSLLLEKTSIFTRILFATIFLCVFCTLNSIAQLADGHNKFFGNILRGLKNNGMTPDPLFTTYWNQATPENAGKHGLYETSRDVYEWDALDEMYAFCQANNIPFKQHTFLFWCCGADADWLLSLSDAQIRAEMEEWIIHFFNRYPNTAYVEVVNEPFQSPPPAKIRNALGGDTNYAWVRWVYDKARQHAPASCELWINENNILKGGGRVNSYKNLINLLKADGNIDAVGMQGHWLENVSASTIQNTLNQLDDLNVPLYITEYEVHIANDNNQRDVWAAQFPVMWEHPAVKGVTLWGYKQGEMWRSNGYLVRTNGSERPAMAWIRNYLSGGGSGGGSLQLQAEDHSDSQGVATYSNFIGSCDNNDWIKFNNVNLGNGYQTLNVRYARGTSSNRRVEVRLGSTSGTKIGEIQTVNTGGWSSYTSQSVTLTGGNGNKTIYFVFKGGDAVGNFDWFEFSGQSGSSIKVFAAGKSNTETMRLLINGNVVKTWNNVGGNASTRSFVAHTYNHNTSVTSSQIRVQLTNDDGGTSKDLRVDKIEVDGTTYQTEASSTYSTGTWNSSNGCGPGYKQSEWLHCNGYFQYSCGNCRVITDESGKNATEAVVKKQDSRPGNVYIYPNPAENQLNVEVYSQEKEEVSIEITDILSRRMEIMSGQSSNQTIQINTSGLPEGLYLVKIKGDQTEVIRRLVVKK